MSRLAVVVPTFRRTESLRRLIRALDSQSLPRATWELIVVENGSGAQSAEDVDSIVATSQGPARVIHLPVNEGPAKARNVGWRSCDAELVAFTDDDCIPSADWLSCGVEEFDPSPKVGVVQGPTVRPPGSERYPYTCLTVVREVLEPSPWFEGCNLFLRREALEAAGGFDESLRMHGEETALGWAVLEAGWTRGWAPRAGVVHELADRPWRWHLRIHFLERHLVLLAARHPGLRACFWRPWAVKRENALFALGLIGVGLRWLLPGRRRLPGLLALPYLLWLYPPGRPPMSARAAAVQVSAHGASLAGKISAWATARTFVL